MKLTRRGVIAGLMASPLLRSEKPKEIRVSSLDECLPLILFGQEWTTKLTFHNFRASPVRIPIEFFATSGQPLAPSFNGARANSTLTVSLEAGQSAVYETAYEPTALATGVGWGKMDIPCEVSACGGVAATVNLRNRADGRPDFEAIFPAQGSRDRTVLPVDNSRGHSTVVMIANDGFSFSTRPATVTISFRDRTNNRLHLDQFDIPNRGAKLLSLSDYPQLRDFQGIADFSSQNSLGITVVGLRINPTNSFTPLVAFEP